MKNQRPKLQTLLLLATGVVLQGLALRAEAQGHRGHVISHRTATGAHHRAQATSQRPLVQRKIHRTPAGFGSAANVRPGFYQQLSAPLHSVPQHGVPLHHAPVHTVPVFVYLDPPVYSEPPPVDPRSIPAAAPQPIYVVTPAANPAPQPAPVAPQPVPAPTPEPVPAPEPTPRSTEPGEVLFSVQPGTARIYLDDDYLGTGEEVAALGAGQMFPPGVHVLEVTHPDYRPQRLVFGVNSEEPTHVLIDLAADRVGRRSRIK